MVPLCSLTGTLIPAGRVYSLFTACSRRSILYTYMLDTGIMSFPDEIQMIGSVLTMPLCLPSVLFPRLFSFLFLAVMCQLHSVATAPHNSLFQSNEHFMESRMERIKQIPSIWPLAWAGFSAVLQIS